MHRSPLGLLLLAATPLTAQAPAAATPGEAPAARDSVYALAVDPADYPDASAIFLLDRGEVRYEADGRSTRTFRQVVQILKEDAVENYEEHSFSYAPGHQRLRVNWLRVVRPDGTVISEDPAQIQDADVPATMGNPVYSDWKVRRASLTGVEVGAIVDYSYTIEELKPFLPGDFYQWWGVTTGLPVRRSRLVVDVPADLEARIVEENLSFARQEVTANGRRVYTWAATDVPTYDAEPFAADSNGVWMSLAISSPLGWGDIAEWYAGLARDRYVATPELEAKVSELVGEARTLDDSLRAVHRWVAQDIRYVSIALGMGGYQPRTPAEVMETGFGDCKDKATLFITALKLLGIEAYPVLLSSMGGVEPELPSMQQFDHAIATVDLPGGYLFTDLTSELTPLGSLPYAEQGEFGLVVHPDGRGEVVTLPADPVEANRSEIHVTGTISEDGVFKGWFEEVGLGIHQYGMRQTFAMPLDATETADLVRNVAAGVFDGASGDSLIAFDGRDLQAEPRVRIRIRNGRAVTTSGGTMLLLVPFPDMRSYLNLAAALEARKPRRFPIDVEQVVGPQIGLSELRVTLPEGWTARLPDPVRAESAFGSYTAEYVQEGRELRITRRMEGTRGVQPPAAIDELIAWYRAVAQDDARFLVIDREEVPTP